MTLPAQSTPDAAAPRVSDVLTLDEAARLLRLDRITVGRLIRAGRRETPVRKPFRVNSPRG